MLEYKNLLKIYYFLLLKDKTPINERERGSKIEWRRREREVFRERCGQNLRVVILLVKSLYTGIKYNQHKTKTVFKKIVLKKQIKNTYRKLHNIESKCIFYLKIAHFSFISHTIMTKAWRIYWIFIVRYSAILLYKVVRVFGLKLKILITTELIEFSIHAWFSLVLCWF